MLENNDILISELGMEVLGILSVAAGLMTGSQIMEKSLLAISREELCKELAYLRNNQAIIPVQMPGLKKGRGVTGYALPGKNLLPPSDQLTQNTPVSVNTARAVSSVSSTATPKSNQAPTAPKSQRNNSYMDSWPNLTAHALHQDVQQATPSKPESGGGEGIERTKIAIITSLIERKLARSSIDKQVSYASLRMLVKTREELKLLDDALHAMAIANKIGIAHGVLNGERVKNYWFRNATL